MKRKKVKFSPKLQSSSLDDIKKFVPKNALDTPVISNYNTLPTSYQKRSLKPSYQGYSFNTNEREEGLDLGIRGIGAKGSIPVDIQKGRLAINPELTGVNVRGSLNNQQIFSENTLEPSLGVTYSPNERLQFGVKGKSLASDRRGVEAGMRYKFKDGGETDPTVGEGGEAKTMISSGQNIESLQRALNNIYPGLNLSTEGVWGPETQEAYTRFKREYSGSPALSNKTGAITSLIGDVTRKQFNKFTGLETRPSPMSERDITSEQLAVLNRAAKDALASGRRYIDYSDYKKEGAIDVNEAYRGDIGNKEAIKNMLSNPATQMQSTIGATDIVITPSFEGLPSDTLAVDRYDFNPGSYGIEESEDIGFKEAWEKSKSESAYQTARNLAQYLGSDPGDPSSRQSIINIGS